MNFKMHNMKGFFLVHATYAYQLKKTHEEKDVPQDAPIRNIRIVRMVLRQL